MLDAINLLLENVLNGEYAQRLADIIYVNDFDFDELLWEGISHGCEDAIVFFFVKQSLQKDKNS